MDYTLQTKDIQWLKIKKQHKQQKQSLTISCVQKTQCRFKDTHRLKVGEKKRIYYSMQISTKREQTKQTPSHKLSQVKKEYYIMIKG